MWGSPKRRDFGSSSDTIAEALKQAYELNGVKIVKIREDGLTQNELRLLAESEPRRSKGTSFWRRPETALRVGLAPRHFHGANGLLPQTYPSNASSSTIRVFPDRQSSLCSTAYLPGGKGTILQIEYSTVG